MISAGRKKGLSFLIMLNFSESWEIIRKKIPE
jgi:hypothetical protein